MTLPHLRPVYLLSAVVWTIAAVAPAPAQTPIQAGAGYVINGPEQLIGGSAHALWDMWGGIGLYLDGKRYLETFVDERTFTTDFDFQAARDEFGDDLLLEEFEWTSFNAAVMRPISDQVIIYAGAGQSRRRAFGEFFDEEEERGAGGFYWVEDPERNDSRLNLLGGMFFQIMPRLSIHFGAESAPTGLTVGASYLLWSRPSAPLGDRP
jgi:hypothetical protein